MEQERTDKGYWSLAALAGIVALVIIVALIAGCNPEKRIAKRMLVKMDRLEAKYNAKSEVDTAGRHWAATRYPVKIGAGKTIFKPGPRTVKTDTVIRFRYLQGDTVEVTIEKTTIVERHDTTHIHDSVETAQCQLNAQRAAETERKYNELFVKHERLQGEHSSCKKRKYGFGDAWALIVSFLIGYFLHVLISKRP